MVITTCIEKALHPPLTVSSRIVHWVDDLSAKKRNLIQDLTNLIFCNILPSALPILLEEEQILPDVGFFAMVHELHT